MAVKELNESNFTEALNQGLPMVVDFWAAWCGPCKMLGSVIDELAEEYEGKIIVGKVNVDENETLCEKYNVMNLPTVLFFQNGEVVNRHVGFAKKNDLKNKFEAIL